VGIGIYNKTTPPMLIDRGPRDNGNRRLLIPLFSTAISSNTPSPITAATTTIPASIAPPSATLHTISEADAAAIVTGSAPELRGVRFGDGFILRGAQIIPTSAGVTLDLVWQSITTEQLNYAVAVHMVDPSGKILAGADYPQDTAHTTVPEGTIWRDVVKIPASKLNGATTIAIGLYQVATGNVPIDRGPRDWGNRRLLIPLPNTMNDRRDGSVNTG
jgi:hypothetical protein